MDEPKPTVTVKALEAHTTHGQAYAIGDEYEIDADLVDTVVVQGKAVPIDHPKAQTVTGE
jgi:hypothetical protein